MEAEIAAAPRAPRPRKPSKQTFLGTAFSLKSKPRSCSLQYETVDFPERRARMLNRHSFPTRIFFPKPNQDSNMTPANSTKQDDVTMPAPDYSGHSTDSTLDSCSTSSQIHDLNIASDHTFDARVVDSITARVGNRQVALCILCIAKACGDCCDGNAMRICANDLCNEDYPTHSSISIKFYGERAPKVTLERYLARLVRYIDGFKQEEAEEENNLVDFPSDGLIALWGAVALIDRLKSRCPQAFQLDELNVHRLFATATLVAFKVLDDACCTNAYFADIAGITLQEMNKLESNLLLALDFNCNLQNERDIAPVSRQFCKGEEQ